MADENQKNEKGGSKKKLIILLVVGLVLIGISVAGTLAALSVLSGGDSKDDMAAADATGEVIESTSDAKSPAIYYPIKPPIIVNFSVKGRQRYAQVEVTLMTREEDVVAAIELHAPMITNALVLLIGGQAYEEIKTAEGKELLRQQCLQELQSILEKEIGKPGVEKVLFTNFVMQ